VSVLGCDVIGHREKKEVHMKICLILNSYLRRAV
jgi:hypothetical protein